MREEIMFKCTSVIVYSSLTALRSFLFSIIFCLFLNKNVSQSRFELNRAALFGGVFYVGTLACGSSKLDCSYSAVVIFIGASCLVDFEFQFNEYLF